MANRAAPALPLDDDARATLTEWARSRALPGRQILRARIVLCAADGLANRAIAERLRCSVPTVLLWRTRFSEGGIAALERDAPRPGRPPLGRQPNPAPPTPRTDAVASEKRRARGSFTIYDVARHAGLSTATVSRVLNGSDKPRAETRERVLQAARDLGYVRDDAARALSSGLKEVVGVVFRMGGTEGDQDEEEGDSPIFYEVVTRGIEASIRHTNFDLLVSMIRTGDASSRLRALVGKTDGLILHDRLLSGGALTELVGQVPVVTLLGRPSAHTMSVRSDNEAGARALLRHLALEHGYRRIAYLSGYADSPDSLARGDALRREAADLGVRLIGGLGWVGDYSVSGGSQVIDRILRTGGELPRAVVCANDLTAIGVMHTLEQHGIGVPDEVAVTGFDDIAMARHLRPTLTTVRQPFRRMGTVAFDLLHGAITGRKISRRDVVLPVELVLRASCGCGPAA